MITLIQLGLEKGFGFRMNQAGDQTGRKHLKLLVVPRHIGVIRPTGCLQVFLNISDRFLQLQKIRGRRCV